MRLLRHPANPILLPDPASDWETYNVFNPSVIYHNGLFHMHYRAQGLDWVSRIGYAVSQDGIHWNRLRRPVLEPVDHTDARGVEDPRVTELDGVFYMAYTTYGSGPLDSFNITPMFARSHNLITWERLGPMVRGEDNKDHMLFPRQIGGRYAALHRRRPNVWLACSDDLVHWPEADMRPIFEPRPNNGWDNTGVGGNGVPIETEHGWLMFYHAYDEQHVYRFGVCLLDLENPERLIHRPKDFIFEPEELWELRGDVSNVSNSQYSKDGEMREAERRKPSLLKCSRSAQVTIGVFSCANPVVDGTVYVYYGGGDHVIGLATYPLNDLLDTARFG